MTTPAADIDIPGTIGEVTADWFARVLASVGRPGAQVVAIRPAFREPRGFLSTHVRVDVDGGGGGGGGSFFVKLNPSDPRYVDFLRRSRYDRLEALFYDVVVGRGLIRMRSLRTPHPRPRLSELVLPVPEALYVASEPFGSPEPRSVIVFRDVGVDGYVTPSPAKEWTRRQLVMAAEALARVNAACYTLSHSLPDDGNRSSEEVRTTLAHFELNDAFFDVAVSRATPMSKALLELVGPQLVGDEACVRFLANLESFLDSNRARLTERVKSCKLACLTQRDCWNNNFLWKFDPGTGEPEDVLICDWQLARVFNPLADLSFMLLSSCSEETRRECVPDVLRAYFDRFVSDCARMMRGEIEQDARYLPSFEEVRESYRTDGVFWGLFNLVFLSPAVADLVSVELSGDGDGAFLTRYADAVREATNQVLQNLESGVCI